MTDARKLRWAAFAWALLAPFPAAAGGEMDEIQITASRRGEPAFEVPLATTVLGPELLRTLTPQTVMDHLHGEPGTFVQQTTPGQGVVIVRGLKGSEVLHLVDGFRLNNGIFRNAPNQYVALVDGLNLDRLEVVRGPMSSLYGSDAMGGVVQMFTHEPRFSGDDVQMEGRLRSIFGSADRSLLSRAETAFGNERVSLSGGFTVQDTDDLRRGGGGKRVPFTDLRAEGGDAKLLLTPATGHELMFSWQRMTQPNTPRVDVLNPSFASPRPEQVQAEFRPQTRSFLHGRYRFEQATPAFDELELHWGRQRIEDGNRAGQENPVGSTTVQQTWERNLDTSDGYTVQFGKALAASHYLTYGGEYYRDRVRSTRERRNVTPGQPVPDFGRLDPRFPDGALLKQFSVFAAHDWQVTPRLELRSGLRYIRVNNDIGNGFDAVRSRDLTGNIGASFALSDTLRLVANAGRGFRAPNIFDVGLLGNRPNNRFSIRNPDLDPETVLGFDVGFKHSSDWLQAEFSVFHSRYKDKITTVRTGVLRDPADPTSREIVQNVNAARVGFSGFEAGARWQVSDSFALYGTATYTRGHEKLRRGIPGADRSHPAERVPPLFGKLGAQWTWRERLTLETYMFYAGSQHRLSSSDREDGRINPNGTPGWSTLNLRASWAATERMGFTLRVENILDRRYREHASGLDEPGINGLASVDISL